MKNDIETIKLLKENISKEIYKEMSILSFKLKEYVSVEHDKNPKYTFVEGICTRINYGSKDNTYFWCYIPNDVMFIHLNKKWKSNMIFYNDKLKCWFVYNRELDKYTEFDSLNIENQILMMEMLENILNQ